MRKCLFSDLRQLADRPASCTTCSGNWMMHGCCSADPVTATVCHTSGLSRPPRRTGTRPGSRFVLHRTGWAPDLRTRVNPRRVRRQVAVHESRLARLLAFSRQHDAGRRVDDGGGDDGRALRSGPRYSRWPCPLWGNAMQWFLPGCGRCALCPTSRASYTDPSAPFPLGVTAGVPPSHEKVGIILVRCALRQAAVRATRPPLPRVFGIVHGAAAARRADRGATIVGLARARAACPSASPRVPHACFPAPQKGCPRGKADDHATERSR